MADNCFYKDIEKFNDLYKLSSNQQPTMLGSERIRQFHDILSEEVNEGLDLAQRYEKCVAEAGESGLSKDEQLELLTELGDWLGDLVVYCASESRRWGLPLNKILSVIMQSNFSKLDANGMPIYDHRGKVMKGPLYWKPEPRIKAMIADFHKSAENSDAEHI